MFGISGKLYKSNLLLYDHQTQSLWSQLLEKSVSGPMVGKLLKKYPSVRVKWKNWLKKNKNTLVLSDQTGYIRDYSTNPYKGYYRLGRIMFPVGNVRKDLPAKKRILGIVIDGNARAYPITSLPRNVMTVEDTIGKTFIRIHINEDGEVINVTNDKGNPVPYIFSYWFAWQAFHPDTTVFMQK